MVLFETNIEELIDSLNDTLMRYATLLELQDKVKFIADYKPNNNLNNVIKEVEKTIISVCEKIQNTK